jgi:protein-L-isoaspartate O-methyltransferase
VLGAPEHAPYDRVIVTDAWDIPTTWWDQLVAGGRLVVPLRWRGQTRAVAFGSMCRVTANRPGKDSASSHAAPTSAGYPTTARVAA